MADFIATGVVADWWTHGSHHAHEITGRVRIGGDQDRMSITRGRRRGYKRQSGCSLGVILLVEGWIVKPWVTIEVAASNWDWVKGARDLDRG